MKICFLSTKHPPLDKRVFEKEARALSEAGFTVLHLAPSKEFQHPFQKDGISIIPLKPVTGIRTRLGQLYKTYQKAKQLDADCYHCNEVDSWFLGVLLKIINKKMVIFDVHEHYPSNFSESRFPRFLRPAIEATVRLVFKLFIPFTDRIVLAKQSVSEDFPGTEEKQVLVQNYAPRCFRGAPQNTSKYTEEEFKIVHLGLFSKVRGWPQLLEALELVSRQEISKRIKANIIGEFNDGTEKEETFFKTR